MATVVKNKRLKAQAGLKVSTEDSGKNNDTDMYIPPMLRNKSKDLKDLRKDQRTNRRVSRLEDRIDRIKLKSAGLRPNIFLGSKEAQEEAKQSLNKEYKKKGGKVKAKTTMKKGGKVKAKVTMKKGGKVKKSK